MGGGLMQLVAYGAQDIYLTGNPQITFFKVVYRRHTNFSMEAIQQTFSGTADFGADVTSTISRNGDLVYRMYLEHDVSLITENADDTLAIGCDYGSHVMKEMELEIGGQRIDKHYGHWHSVWSQLTEFNPSGSQTTLFNRMCGNGVGLDTNPAATPESNGFTTVSNGGGIDTATAKLFIPLYFWFCRNPGLALPLIALQYHEVKVKITFEGIDKLIATDTDADFANSDNQHAGNANNVTSKNFKLWCDYIYLDTDERRRFAQVSHEYLIEQVQEQSLNAATTNELNFNHPVKELIWTRSVAASGALNYAATQPPIADSTETYHIKLNGHDRFAARAQSYFARTQVWESHSGYGGLDSSAAAGIGEANDGICVYSFSLKPEEHQPSGTCNFSRIDNAQLVSSAALQSQCVIFAVNYNVLRIMSGMGGLAYSN